MKRLFLSFLLTVLISPFLMANDIADVVIERNGSVSVKDASNNVIFTGGWNSGWELCGFSSTIIVIKETNGRIYVRDRKFEVIADKAISSDEKVKNVVGNTISIKHKSGRVTTYDKNFNQLSERYE